MLQNEEHSFFRAFVVVFFFDFFKEFREEIISAVYSIRNSSYEGWLRRQNLGWSSYSSLSTSLQSSFKASYLNIKVSGPITNSNSLIINVLIGIRVVHLHHPHFHSIFHWVSKNRKWRNDFYQTSDSHKPEMNSVGFDNI